VEAMLAHRGQSLAGMRVSVSGSGNVAQYAIEKAMALGACVISASDSGGTVYDPDGFTPEKLARLMELKNEQRKRVADYAHELGLEFFTGRTPWHLQADVALPCATQNELGEEDARLLVKQGVQLVAEGANMPSSAAAIKVFHEARVLFAPGKAANAGGVATSGLEMSQNAQRLSWTREEVDARLKGIMTSIHATCVRYGQDDDHVNYESGANIAGFVKVADAMLAQGVC
ncbi:glutamate dehydrogenase, partial [Aeromonas media]|nr:glutamate dehydrogenase [Aeromonas media]